MRKAVRLVAGFVVAAALIAYDMVSLLWACDGGGGGGW